MHIANKYEYSEGEKNSERINVNQRLIANKWHLFHYFSVFSYWFAESENQEKNGKSKY